ncbi:hypothetical protein [Streptomyces longwoodensis]|uniref:hypothetical protein n=1 Tax=Streptomyces longwoodensis TaxID=68231 RepID=UPI0036EC749B
MGIGLTTTPITTAAMGDVPPERTGIASGTLNASRMVGLSLGSRSWVPSSRPNGHEISRIPVSIPGRSPTVSPSASRPTPGSRWPPPCWQSP